MPENTNTPKPTNPTAWYDRTGDNHPAQLEPCTECHAAPGAPCVSTVGLTPHGVTGTPIRGLHAARVDEARVYEARVDEARKAAESVVETAKGAA